MFSKQTCFVLGAGASRPYGFPLGKELIVNILNDMNDKIFFIGDVARLELNSLKKTTVNDVKECLDKYSGKQGLIHSTEYGYPEKERDYETAPAKTEINGKYVRCCWIRNIPEFAKLAEALREFDPVSIDTFLRDNPSYAEAGKIMIVYSLLKRENKLAFHTGGCSDNWYNQLLNDLTSECADNPKKLLDNKLNIITFNYDVSLDYYLRDRFSKIERFNEPCDGEKSIADQFILSIDHVYGSITLDLSNYKYGIFDVLNHSQVIADPRARVEAEYQSILGVSRRFYKSIEAHDNIKTMYDERNLADRLKERQAELRAKLDAAEEIIFIGFGFDADNLHQLGLPGSYIDWCTFCGSGSNKTIRWLNFKNSMTGLSKQFEEIRMRPVNTHPGGAASIIESTADSISDAYQNDFKKFLF